MLKLNFKTFRYKQFQKLSVYGFGQFFNLLTPLLILPRIIRVCGEENFGKSAIGMSVAFFLIVFIDFGCDILGVKDISINRNNTEKRNYIISRVFYIKSFFLLLFSGLFLIVINKFAFFDIDKKMYLFSFSIFIAQIVNPLWIFQGLEKFNLFSAFSILSKSFYIILIFIFLKQKSDYIYINLAFGISVFSSGIFFYFILNKYHNFNFVSISFSELFMYIYSNRTYVISQIFVWMQLYSPILLINYFGTSLQVGQFRIIDQIISILRTYVLLSFNFIYPKICFEFDKNENKALKSWQRFNEINFLFLFLLLIILFVFSHEVIEYYNIINKDFLIHLFKIALIYPLLFFTVYALKQLLFALHYEKIFSKIIISMSILNLTIISIIYKKYNLLGVFYSFISVEFITLLILILLILKYKILGAKKEIYEV